ncbi:hypothetical protein J5Y04_28620 [Kitasatospora sp. RG8]|uniref:hypothetical protein n=1 Tax=Kitasatospora sp. RG8 TaxID=2820815 RepID=UPI001ADFD283|nr:hypothetical protein [Kitasatospora sp. RG8]MBP0453479.1 hypothetical protein [Kitasatospora sp. RG8]
MAELVVRPTPVVACKTRAEFDRTTVIVPALLAELSRGGCSNSWTDTTLPHALEIARQSVRKVAPRAWWHLWESRQLQPRAGCGLQTT